MTPLDLTQRPPRSPRDELAGVCMLPRMIDIARAKLPGGNVGEYQIGRGLSGAVLQTLGMTAEQFVDAVARATDEPAIAAELRLENRRRVLAQMSARLRQLTVADVPAELRPQFQGLYGNDLPRDRKVFDILDADDAKAFPR